MRFGDCDTMTRSPSTAMPSGARISGLWSNTVLLVRSAVSVGVFEDDDAVPFGADVGLSAKLPSIVHGLEHPDTPALVDGDVGRIGQARLGGPERHVEPGRGAELPDGLPRGLLTQHRGVRRPREHSQDNDKTEADGARDGRQARGCHWR